MNDLKGIKIAALMTEGFEQVEFTKPKQALEDAGATVHLIAPKAGQVKAWDDTDWGDAFPADLALSDAEPADYDALLLPGGVMNPDTLRTNEKAIDFIQSFFDDMKPVAAICHAPTLLVEADVVQGKQLTSYPSIQTDLRNAGANWVDQPVVTDGNLVTSRQPDDIPAFNKAFIELIMAGTAAEA